MKRRPGLVGLYFFTAMKFQHAGVAVFGAESQQRALGVPGQRRDRRAAVAAHQDFRAVLEPDDQHGAVAVARGHDVLLRMTGDRGDARLQRRQHRRLLAHRAVLAGERPDDHGIGARGGKPLAARAPRHRADAAGIAAHAHVPVVGEPPAMQRRLVHRGDQEFVVGAEGDGEMRAGPFQKFRLRRHVGKPQRHAVVMRDRHAQAFRRERQPADGRGRIEGFLLALAAADERRLARRPRHRAIGMQRDIVDPAPLGVGREHRDLALGVERDDLAVIAAGDDARAVGRRAQDGAAMDGDGRNLARRRSTIAAFSSAPTKHRGIAEEMHRR